MDDEWVDLLLEDLSRATEGRPSRPHSCVMLSALRNTHTYLQPVVTARKQYIDGTVEFTLSLFKVPLLDFAGGGVSFSGGTAANST